MPKPPSTGGVTSPFGPRESPGGIGSSWHLGEDRVGAGNYAPVTGEIVYADYNSGWGYIFGIRESATVVWWVAHNANLAGVRVGAFVNIRDYVAPLGSTGNSTGPHSHTERRVGGSDWPGTGTATDPALYYSDAADAGSSPLPEEEDIMELKRVIFDQGDRNAPDFASTATIDSINGLRRTSTGWGPRGELEGATAIANVLGFRVTEQHVDANGWRMAQERFAKV